MSKLVNKEILCHRLDEAFSDFFINQLKNFDWDDYEGMMAYAGYYRKFLFKIKRNIWDDRINISNLRAADNLTPGGLILRNMKSFIRVLSTPLNK